MTAGIVGLWILALGPRSPSLAEVADELSRRLGTGGLTLECLEMEEPAARTPVTLDLVLRGLSEPLSGMEALRRRLEHARAGVVAVWSEGGGLIRAHRVLKAVRGWTSPYTETVLTGPGVAQHLEEWSRTPEDLRTVMSQTGQYVFGDPVRALEALVRDRLRLEPMPWLIPGVLCLESEQLQLDERRR